MARPKTFDPENALRQIKRVFWQQGYEGTSMQNIEQATGLKKQSLYREFGDKRQMYLKALAHYNRFEVAGLREVLLVGGTARENFTRLFTRMIDDAIRTGDRSGCFLCNSAIDQAQLDASSLAVVEQGFGRTRDIFLQALDNIKTANTDAIAAHLLSAYFGLRVLIKANASESILRDAASQAVTTF